MSSVLIAGNWRRHMRTLRLDLPTRSWAPLQNRKRLTLFDLSGPPSHLQGLSGVANLVACSVPRSYPAEPPRQTARQCSTSIAMLDTDISSNQRRRQSESEFVDSKARSDEIPRDGVAEVGPEAAISARAGLRVADGGTAQQSCHLSCVKPKTGLSKGTQPTQACAAASREARGHV